MTEEAEELKLGSVMRVCTQNNRENIDIET